MIKDGRDNWREQIVISTHDIKNSSNKHGVYDPIKYPKPIDSISMSEGMHMGRTKKMLNIKTSFSRRTFSK